MDSGEKAAIGVDDGASDMPRGRARQEGDAAASLKAEEIAPGDDTLRWKPQLSTAGGSGQSQATPAGQSCS